MVVIMWKMASRSLRINKKNIKKRPCGGAGLEEGGTMPGACEGTAVEGWAVGSVIEGTSVATGVVCMSVGAEEGTLDGAG
jgi:hypothetical protein